MSAFAAALEAYAQSRLAEEPAPERPVKFAEGTVRIIPGLVRCATCGVLAKPLHGHLSVHYASLTERRPCVNSWPPSKPETKQETKAP
jgi:hypothetical protein